MGIKEKITKDRLKISECVANSNTSSFDERIEVHHEFVKIGNIFGLIFDERWLNPNNRVSELEICVNRNYIWVISVWMGKHPDWKIV